MVSPFTGTVVEVVSTVGGLIGEGSSMATVAPARVPLDAYLFIPRGSSGVKPGMEVQIEMDAAKAEEYGYVRGVVKSITPQPISREAMIALLRNDLLVSEYSSEGNPRMVQVDLLEDEAASLRDGHLRFRWTTAKGADVSFHSGMRLTGRVLTKQQRPIELVLPTLKAWLGI